MWKEIFTALFVKHGILEDDNQYHLAIQEASVSNSASNLCSLFAVILTCEPSNPLDIYKHHKEHMAEDFLHQQHTRLNDNDLSFNNDIFNLALNDLQDEVLSMGSRELSGTLKSLSCGNMLWLSICTQT